MKNYEARHIILAISIAIIVILPIVLLVLPTAMIHTLYARPSQFVLYATGASYLVYGASLLFLFFSVFVIFLLWGKKLLIVGISLTSLLLGGIAFYFATEHYVSIGTDHIAYQLLFSPDEYVYGWDEVEKAVYFTDDYDKIAATYEFTFTDGNTVKLPENAYLSDYQFMIHNLIRSHEIEFVERFYDN